MKCEVDGFERGVRIGLGACLLLWALFDEGEARLWGYLGLWPLVTGLVRFCPVCLPLRLATRGTHSGSRALGGRRDEGEKRRG